MAPSRVSVELGFTAPGGYLLRCQGAFQALHAGLLPAWDQSRGGRQPAKPSQSLQRASASWKPPASVSLCYSVGPPQPQDFLCPHTPILLRAELQVPTRDRRLGRGNEGAVFESQTPTGVTCPFRSSGILSFRRSLKTHQASGRRGLKEGKEFPLNTAITKTLRQHPGVEYAKHLTELLVPNRYYPVEFQTLGEEHTEEAPH